MSTRRRVGALTLLAFLGPLSVPSAGLPPKVGYFHGQSLSGNFVAREMPGEVSIHAILDPAGADDLTDVVIGFASGRCGARAGQRLVIAKGTLPTTGAHLQISVGTGDQFPNMRSARSLRVFSRNQPVACTGLQSLRRPRKGQRKPPKVSVSESTAAAEIGEITITFEKPGSLTHSTALTAKPPGGLPSGAGEASPNGRASIIHTYQQNLEFKGKPLASWTFQGDHEAGVLVNLGSVPTESRVTPRARSTRIMMDDDLLVFGALKSYTFRRCAYPYCGG